MISADSALRFARKHFPMGPETLAEHLHAEILVSPLGGCDGWCLTASRGTVIRLNELSSQNRRRFTLAHELGHLILGVPTVVGETIYESLKSDDEEERQVNDFAAELLLPSDVVNQHVPGLPVVAAQLKKLAAAANVSQLAAAIRVANLAEEIGLENASVAFFEGGEFTWHWSPTLGMTRETATALLTEARKTAPIAARLTRKDKKVIVASLIDNSFNNTSTLFVQLLSEEDGGRLTAEERRRELEDALFVDDHQFRCVFQGCLSATKQRASGKPLASALADFNDRYGKQWEGAQRKKLLGSKGQEYLRLRLQEWCK
jgi:hypothetical protein